MHSITHRKHTLPKNHSFNVMLDDQDRDKLYACSLQLKVSRGLCIRQAIDALHNMTVLNLPTCANGRTCYVPQMHPPHTRPPAPTPATAQE